MEVTDQNFESAVLQSKTPVLVDFWAPWCGPCKAIGPIVEQLAASFADRVTFAKCNVDQNPAIPTRYGIKAIPTLMFFRDGKLFDQVTGMVGKQKLQASLEGLLQGKEGASPFVVS
jgi:thioredoxin 1